MDQCYELLNVVNIERLLWFTSVALCIFLPIKLLWRRSSISSDLAREVRALREHLERRAETITVQHVHEDQNRESSRDRRSTHWGLLRPPRKAAPATTDKAERTPCLLYEGETR